MKKKIFIGLSLLISVFTMTFCSQSEIEENVEAFTKFDIDYVFTYPLSFLQFGEPAPAANATVPGPFETMPPLEQKLPTNFEAELKKNNADKDDIRLITLNDIRITLREPMAENFNFLDKVTLDLKISDVEILRLGELEGIADLNTAVLTIPSSSTVNFKAFIDRPELTVLASFVANSLTNTSYVIDVQTSFEVTPCVSIFEATEEKCEGI